MNKEIAFNKLNKLIFSQNKCVRVSDLVDILDVHIEKAFSFVKEFVEKEKNRLDITYYIHGSISKEDEDLKIHRFMLVESDELEKSKEKFIEIQSSGIWSLEKCKDEEKANVNTFISESRNCATDEEAIRSIQKKSFIVNEEVKIRNDIAERLKCLISTKNDGNDESNQENMEEDVEMKDDQNEIKKENGNGVKDESLNGEKKSLKKENSKDNEDSPPAKRARKNLPEKQVKKNQVLITSFFTKPKPKSN